MARIDDYVNAKKIAVDKLIQESFEELATKSGFNKLNNKFQIKFLNKFYELSFPEFKFSSQDNKDIPIQEQVIILHYLGSCIISQLKNQWIAYREIPDASFYFSAFSKRAIEPLKKAFGLDIISFAKTCEKLNGKAIDFGDAGFEFQVFPKVPIRLILWQGDNEFAPEANILFDETIQEVLSPEDIAWLSGMLVYRLIMLKNN